MLTSGRKTIIQTKDKTKISIVIVKVSYEIKGSFSNILFITNPPIAAMKTAIAETIPNVPFTNKKNNLKDDLI